MYAQVCPINRSFDDSGISYAIPQDLRTIAPGYIVEVPYGKNNILAVVLKVGHDAPDIDSEKIKSIIACPYDFAFLRDYQIEFVLYIAKHYFSLLHHVLALFLPKNLKEKIQKGKFSYIQEDISYRYENNSQLTEGQQRAFMQLKESSNPVQLFYGVTGSGKTNIYIEMIQEKVIQGKQSLLLVPEIILTSQTVASFKKIFGNGVVEIHSSVSEAQKTKNWQNIYSGNAKIIIGTRSALFYPYKNLGLVIVDEEHDRSYISDSSPRYNAKVVAQKLGEYLDVPVIFASGTPSTNTMYKAVKKEIGLVTLLEEYTVNFKK